MSEITTVTVKAGWVATLLAGACIAGAGPTWAKAVYVIDDFGTPSTALSFSGSGTGSIVDQLVPGARATFLQADTDVNPLDGVATVSYGGGQLTVSSPSQGRTYASVGYDDFANHLHDTSLDTTPYNYFEFQFAYSDKPININALLYSGTPTGPNIYYDGGSANVDPPKSGGPFTVYIPIPAPAGFDRANVNGEYFEIDVASNQVGTGWALDKFALTSGTP